MLYASLRIAVRSFFSFFYRWKVEGVHHIPKEGPVVICANHISNLDPPLLGAAMDRRIHFMAKQELFRIPLFSMLIRVLGAFPVKRGSGDLQALKQALRLLQEEKVLGIFPEGTRSRDGKLGRAHTGAALIALRAGAPVVPAAIIGPYRLFRPVRIIFGQPIEVTSPAREKIGMKEAAALTDRIMNEIKQMIDQHR
ncbi:MULTISPECIES: 1-acyl-sn-glycerol-3-phosphate acyltransferase [Thermoactinomyces]|jgi:1-acyl-sn-glycerol-3-phosphate acyltransferase|uniref:1-acyl-sn-glycerol-3-phosphate acyltransferase n=1 Tax=Thermoactinomyces daqus TaxID=1329516 RepID=A0A7W2AHV0_9BACL|nr:MULTISPECIES: lysophospholipid acyltransferase family protein [Thermoactinomyces]MBA4543121.1 1-acyl-sn-glycerol-3-phosphate acyltransferase [Thermoactinomyces daqus]MBH8596644.1 1-acyl-sn-glycerol-3-phosphate acyltransferase [Thermoactinomyces sp. CICC 10523]MBH8603406.1 1-acyl-sn-glycerol-3-phosphate acyltransferase [Thermoactinomyces sp. CICC 10522]MBH8607827.1 1-acyl-sn-glycerol-3-phosphate acyltransferase [Thermoactinomyces sp. CICC 10521]